MIFGLPGAALAMYRCAKPEKKKSGRWIIAFSSIGMYAYGYHRAVGVFILVCGAGVVCGSGCPGRFGVYGRAYAEYRGRTDIFRWIPWISSCLEFYREMKKTSWMRVIPVGIIYFILYYAIFTFMIKKFNFKTPGREDDDAETKLYTKADVNARKEEGNQTTSNEAHMDPVSALITKGLGGKANISDVDCCATRLRITVEDAGKVNEDILKQSGSRGIVKKGQGVQIIYGPQVTVIKANLEDYLETADDSLEETEEVIERPSSEENAVTEKTVKDEGKVTETIIISSPITGKAVEVAEIPDEGFAGKMMGDGAGVTPTEAEIVALEDGVVAFVFETKHALGFQTDSGLEMLLHIGIDTVALNGQGFEVFVENGQSVKKGDLLMKIDVSYLTEHAPSLCSPVLCTDLKENQKVRLLAEGEVKAGEPLFAVDCYEK